MKQGARLLLVVTVLAAMLVSFTVFAAESATTEKMKRADINAISGIWEGTPDIPDLPPDVKITVALMRYNSGHDTLMGSLFFSSPEGGGELVPKTMQYKNKNLTMVFDENVSFTGTVDIKKRTINGTLKQPDSTLPIAFTWKRD